jgi:lipopolysaccharide transport protein LptA
MGACGLVVGPAQAQQSVSLDKCEDTITLKSQNQGTFNLRDKAIQLGKVDISGCGARIRANNAVTTNADFEDSTWTFDGDVRIDLDTAQGTLTSDKAVVIFRNNQLSEATITGSPAEFEHKRGNVNTRGSAGRIVYDLATQNIRLADDARVTDGGRLDVKAATLAYNLRTQDLDVAGKGSGRGYTLVIDPRLAKKKNGEKPDEKKPEAKPPTP